MRRAQEMGDALLRVRAVVDGRDGIHIVHSSEVQRNDRELLVHKSWLKEIIQGWYLFTRPDLHPGDSSAWYATFWDFLHVYLHHYYGKDYCLSAGDSLDQHLGKTVVPKQVIVMARQGRGQPIELPFNTSVMIYAPSGELPPEREEVHRLQVMTLSYALCKVSPTFFQTQPQDAEIALQAIRDGDDLLRVIIRYGFVRAAGRIFGAYRFLQNEKMVRHLLQGLAMAKMVIQETNPFEHPRPLLTDIIGSSPYAARIFAIWEQYRECVIQHFKQPPGLPADIDEYLADVEEKYAQDAYHSLSIEGYHVNQELIERVRNNHWHPEQYPEDQRQSDALAARGYYEAFVAVKESLNKILNHAGPGEVVKADLAQWYRSLFAPNVAAEIIHASDLIGYRSHQVYIRQSRHTPFPRHALNDAMDAFFICLQRETHAGVRAILGHFVFVFIHPYMDGNGRIGRFLMNAMLASGGYPWTIVHCDRRKEYFRALEQASTEDNIVSFVKFIADEIN